MLRYLYLRKIIPSHKVDPVEFKLKIQNLGDPKEDGVREHLIISYTGF